MNELTNKNAAANSSRTKDISANEPNRLGGKRVISVNRTESNDLCALKEFCDIKRMQSAPLIPRSTHDNNRGLQRTRAFKANWNSDGLHGKILKLSAPVISDTLTYVYNLFIQKCYVPAAFKQAKIIPLFKSGTSSDPSNYRPVSIFSALSRPFKKHILLHILTKRTYFTLTSQGSEKVTHVIPL